MTTETKLHFQARNCSMARTCYVYITTNKNRTVLYVGVTKDLHKRLNEHYNDSKGLRFSFAGKYKCYHLVYFESYTNIGKAFRRKNVIKKWRREKKERLVEALNPEWEFLNDKMV